MKWNIDASHSTAEFTVRHMMITNVRGRFGKLEGSVEYDPQRPELSKFDATIDASSIDTRDEKRDTHLRSGDFFDVEKYPTITFKSTSIKKTGDGFEATGDLTMHGVTKQVTLEIEGPSAETKDPWGNDAHRRVGARQDQPQGLGPQLERGARGGRRARAVRPSRSRSKCRSSPLRSE